MNCTFGFVLDMGGERFILVRIAVTPVQWGPVYPADDREKQSYWLGTYWSLLQTGWGFGGLLAFAHSLTLPFCLGAPKQLLMLTEIPSLNLSFLQSNGEKFW